MAKVAAKAAAMPSKSARTQRNKRTRDEDEAGPAEVVNGTKGKRPRAAKKGRKKVIYDSDALDDSEAEDEPEDEYEAGSGSEPEVSRDEDEEDDEPVRKKQKRSSTASGAGGGSKLKKSARGSAPSKAKSKTPKSKSKARSGAQTRRKKASDSDEDADEGKDNESDDNDDVELKEGQEIVGKVVQAPTTGRGKLLSLCQALAYNLWFTAACLLSSVSLQAFVPESRAALWPWPQITLQILKLLL
ncbi:hypothetical protein AX16_009080 [Volvariella volvacea WC 439]|nr:hypothetical protein AX16_009080 [Volvariella volvacea WC 439]